MYDPHTNSWEQLPSMLIPRSGSSAAVVKGCIYVIGKINLDFFEQIIWRPSSQGELTPY